MATRLLGLLGICFWRDAPETAVGPDRRAGKRGLFRATSMKAPSSGHDPGRRARAALRPDHRRLLRRVGLRARAPRRAPHRLRPDRRPRADQSRRRLAPPAEPPGCLAAPVDRPRPVRLAGHRSPAHPHRLENADPRPAKLRPAREGRKAREGESRESRSSSRREDRGKARRHRRDPARRQRTPQPLPAGQGSQVGSPCNLSCRATPLK